ncbi:MAG: hypothetical protein ACXAB0_05375 [Candidatus Thorarchaeota archaeon]
MTDGGHRKLTYREQQSKGVIWILIIVSIMGGLSRYGTTNILVVIAGIGSILLLVVVCLFDMTGHNVGEMAELIFGDTSRSRRSSSKSLAAIVRFRDHGRYPRYEVRCPKCGQLNMIRELRSSLVIKCIKCGSTIRVVKSDKNYEVSCPYCSHTIAHADLPYLPDVRCGLCGQVIHLKDGHIRKDEA